MIVVLKPQREKREDIKSMNMKITPTIISKENPIIIKKPFISILY